MMMSRRMNLAMRYKMVIMITMTTVMKHVSNPPPPVQQTLKKRYL